MTELDKVVQQLRELRQMRDELEGEIEVLTDQMKIAMLNRGTEELTGPGWTATWHTVESNRLDAKALRHDMPDLYERYCKPVTTCRFCLT